MTKSKQINNLDKKLESQCTNQTINESQHQLLTQIQEEYNKGFLTLNSLPQFTVTFYGGARIKDNSKTYHDIYEIAKEFSLRDWGIISGGGPGVMAASLKGSIDGKGSGGAAFRIAISDEPVEINPEFSLLFSNFSVRKYMLRQSDVFIYAPGGLGTLDELMENLTLMKTDKYPIKPIFLYDAKFWEGYVDWFKQMILSRELASPDFLNLFKVVDSKEEIIDYLFVQHKERAKTLLESRKLVDSLTLEE